MEIKYKTINDLPLDKYTEVTRISDSKELSEGEKDIALMAVLCDTSEEEIYSLPLHEVQLLRSKLILEATKRVEHREISKVVIEGMECDVTRKVQDITYAQFVDFQTYWQDIDKNRTQILSTFIVPKGKKYNTDYDISEFQAKIGRSVTIGQFNELLYFFLDALQQSIEVSRQSLLATLMTMRTMTRNEKEKEALEKAVEEVRQMRLYGYR